MFSVMTALLSPKVVETLEGRRDALFQTLQERAGVLCVQPSHGICMLQGEWECMKKAHLVLEEFCLQVQAQKSMRNGPVSKVDLQKAFGLTGQSTEENHLKIYEEMQQRQIAYAQWAATLNHQMVAGAHLAQQMAAHMQQLEGQSGHGGRRSANPLEPPPREDTPLNLKKELDPPRLEKYDGAKEDAESYRDADDGDNTLAIAVSEDETSQGPGSPRLPRSGGGNIEDLSGKNGRPSSRATDDGVTGDLKPLPSYGEHNGSTTSGGAKPSINPLQAMTQALANKTPSMRDNAKYADPKMGMTAEGMISAQLLGSGLPYGPHFRTSQNSPAPDPEMALRPPFMSQNYRLAAVELALLEGRIQDTQSKALAGVLGDTDGDKERYTPEPSKTYTTTPIMPPKDRSVGGGGSGGGTACGGGARSTAKDMPGWPPRPPGSVPEGMEEDYDDQFYKCSACFAGFSNADALQEHMMTTHAVGPGLTAEKTSNLIISPSADAYCCPVCGKFYKSSQRLREHIPLHDKNYQRPTYPCPACHKTFTYRHNMKVHYQKIHKGREPPKRHECTICGQKFHKPVYLRNHLLRHKDNPDTNALDYTLAPSPHPMAPVTSVPGTGSIAPVGGGPESIGGEDTSASGSPGTTTSE